MEEGKKRSRKEILQQMPMFPHSIRGEKVEMTEEKANKLYDMIEESYDKKKKK